jgi:hypothetical protein
MLRTARSLVPLLLTGVLLAAPRAAVACSACIGRSDDTAVQGLNAAVVTLSGALALVLGMFAGFIACLVRRAVKRPLALPRLPGGVVQ